MRVLVCGGRDFKNLELLRQTMDSLLGVSCIIEGGALGADKCAAYWAQLSGIPIETFCADWKTHGKAAGPIRNKRMLDEGKPDLVVAFPGGRGTSNMMMQARKAGVPVMEIKP